MQRALTSLVCSTLPLAILGCLIPLTAIAQITADGTTSTTVNQNGNDFTIEQGDRVGDHLFHSFNEFSVPTLGSAVFNNASDIANIFSRVTGSNISDIDGLLSANGAANLFLMNPNGIIFGPNARLNLGGSFFASSADSLLFEGNAEFSASNPTAPPLLKISVPIGINFRDNPGEIINRSTVENSAGDVVGLEVLPGENLTLVGGNINFEAGNATASGGNIELGGLSIAGTVTFNNNGSLSFPEDVAKTDIILSNAADVDVRGTGGGSITINAGNLKVEAGEFGISFIRAGIIADSTAVDAQAGDIRIYATDNITVDESLIGNQVFPEAVGDAGGVTITTGSLNLTNGGQVDASTFGQGNAGSVNITASDTITIDGATSVLGLPSAVSSVVLEAVGDGGDITITTGSLNLTNGGLVNAGTFGQGNAGNVTLDIEGEITVHDGIISSIVGNGAVGEGGTISIQAGSLSLLQGGQILVDVKGINEEQGLAAGQGNAGSILIDVDGEILISGRYAEKYDSGIFSKTDSETIGNAGNITINAGSLSLDGGSLNSDTSELASMSLVPFLGSAGRSSIPNRDSAVISIFPPIPNSALATISFPSPGGWLRKAMIN